jgi:predicted DsbA family dithiol-disulfide isomerase
VCRGARGGPSQLIRRLGARPKPEPPDGAGRAVRICSLTEVEPVEVTIYTDPGCPFGFNAQRQEAQLLWHYGEGLDISRRMIVLSERSSFEELGLSREMIAGNARRLSSLYAMPMLTEPRDRMAATIQACRAYVGARINDPQRADLLLRALRRRAFSHGQPLDELDTIHAAGSDAGIAPDSIDAWLGDEEVEQALRDDMAATRAPLPEALALAHRLSRSNGGLRYSTASAVFEHGDRRVVMAGFQPFAVYEVAVANVAPELERRPSPGSVEEVLSWAPYPLATAEVAELMGLGLDEARDQLRAAGAELDGAAEDGYWSRPSTAAV